jgi:hypothetical protein
LSSFGLQNTAFLTAHLPADCALRQFIQIIESRTPQFRVNRVYCLRGTTVAEVVDTDDLHSLLATGTLSDPVKVIISPTEGLVPHAALFSPHLLDTNFSFLESAPFTTEQKPTLALPVPTASVEEEFCWTVRDLTDDIREVYTSSRSLVALTAAVAEEFQKSVTKLIKASTGARLTNDRNILHLKETDIIIAHFA